jgi:hypothetical protein
LKKLLNDEVFGTLCDVELLAQLTPENRRKLLEKARTLVLTQNKNKKSTTHSATKLCE